ncbi:MAG: hypothetical protein WCJ84_05475 [Candidatus Peregrinibacteria bacterium]
MDSFLPFFPVFFLAMWLGISALLSTMGGWKNLAQRFPAPSFVTGERFSFASAAFGNLSLFPVRYNRCLVFTVGETGFFVSPFFFFRFWHSPIFIPWESVVSVTPEKYWFFSRSVVKISETETQIGVLGDAGKGILEAYEKYST